MRETPQDPEQARSADLRHLRARARLARPLRGRVDRDRASRSAPTRRARCSAAAPGVRWSTTRPPTSYPTPAGPPARDEVFVGRIRDDASRPQRPGAVGRGRQPAQGRRHQRRTDRRAACRSAAWSAFRERRPRSVWQHRTGHAVPRVPRAGATGRVRSRTARGSRTSSSSPLDRQRARPGMRGEPFEPLLHACPALPRRGGRDARRLRAASTTPTAATRTGRSSWTSCSGPSAQREAPLERERTRAARERERGRSAPTVHLPRAPAPQPHARRSHAAAAAVIVTTAPLPGALRTGA